MKADLSIGRYFAGNSPIHRLDPRTKLISAIGLMVALFLFSNLTSLLIMAMFTIVLIMVAQIPWRAVLSSLKPIIFILLFAFMINLFSGKGAPLIDLHFLTITAQGIRNACTMSLRLLLVIVTTSVLLTLTTTPKRIADALEKLLAPLARFHFPVHELAMMMSIAMRFVPTLLDEVQKIMRAQSSRGADYDTGKMMAKAKGLVSILVPLFVGAFRRADELATAMESRAYHGGEGRTRFLELKYQLVDAIFVIAVILIIITLVLLQKHVALI